MEALMLTSERTRQFCYLLSTILRLAGNSVSSRDATIMAFFRTAEHFNIQEPTVRDMVTRSCDVHGVALFHDAIRKLYEGDTLTFRNLFFSHLPKTYHIEVDALCKKFTEAKKPVSESAPELTFFMKKFIKTRDPDEKRALLNLVQNGLSASA